MRYRDKLALGVPEAGQCAHYCRRQAGHAPEAGGIIAQSADYDVCPAGFAGGQPKPSVPQPAGQSLNRRPHGRCLAAEEDAWTLPAGGQKPDTAKHDTAPDLVLRVRGNAGGRRWVRRINGAGYHPHCPGKCGGGPWSFRCDAQKSFRPDDGMGAQEGGGLVIGLGAPLPMQPGGIRQGPCRRPHACGIGAERAQTGAGEATIAVGGVFRPVQPRRAERGAQPARRHGQHGPQQAQAVGFGECGHPRQTGRASAAQMPHQQCFSLISGMMAQKQVDDAGLATGLFQSLIAGAARTVRYAGAGCQIRQGKNTGRNPKVLQRRRGRSGFSPGIRAQPMIDDESQELPPLHTDPGPGKDSKGQTISAARDRDAQDRSPAERAKRLKQESEFRSRNGLRKVACGVATRQQPSLLCWAAIGCTR